MCRLIFVTSERQKVHLHLCRVGQNRIYTPYMTVYLVISMPKIPYIHCIYMVLANPTFMLPFQDGHASPTPLHLCDPSLL